MQAAPGWCGYLPAKLSTLSKSSGADWVTLGLKSSAWIDNPLTTHLDGMTATQLFTSHNRPNPAQSSRVTKNLKQFSSSSVTDPLPRVDELASITFLAQANGLHDEKLVNREAVVDLRAPKAIRQLKRTGQNEPCSKHLKHVYIVGG